MAQKIMIINAETIVDSVIFTDENIKSAKWWALH